MPVPPKFVSRLSFKVPLMMSSGAVLASLAIGGGAFLLARQSARTQMETALASTIESRASTVTRYFAQAQVNVRLLAEMPTVAEALDTLAADIRTKGDNAQAELQKLYIADNPFGEAERSRYNGENDQTSYGFYHEKIHKILNQARILFEQDDLLVINPAGVVVYSSVKARDFVANVQTGPLKDSGLGQAFRGAIEKAKFGQAAFADFAPYEALNGAPASFLAQAVKGDKGAVIGVVVARLGSQVLSASINQAVGQTGRVFAVGPDHHLRTEIENGTDNAGALAFDDSILNGIGGKTVVGEGVGTSGNQSVLVARAVRVFGQPWAIVAEQTVAEADGPIVAMGLKLAAMALAILAAVSVFGWLASRMITRPILRMRDAVSALAQGEDVKIEAVSRADEIGELARSLSAIHAAGVEAARIRSALDGCPTNVMVVDEQNIIRYLNPAVDTLFRDHLADFKATLPHFDPDAIVGQSMGIFHRNAAHQERMLAELDGTQVSRIRIGDRKIDLAVSPVKDAAGQRLGAMLEWRDMTVELAAQEEVAAVAKAAAAGDFSGRVPLEGKAGFMRDLAAAMNELGAGVDRATTELAAAMNALAQGDLTRSIETDYKGRFGELKDALNETIAHLSQTVGTLQTTAEDVGSAAREIASGANDLSSRTEQQASSLEETAATTEELAASVKASAQSSRQAVELADQAMAVASDGGGIVRDAVEAMARIEQASQKISDITGVIDEIAFQTNLLALNASVEAARAGDAGKGFAVVASEVRTLAQRSSEAAKDITALINASGAEVAQGVKLVRGAGEALEKIVQASRKVSSTVGEISAASGEQANGIDEMSQAVANMDEMTQQNAALAEQSAASAGSLTTQIQKLEELVGGFRTHGRPARRIEVSEPTHVPEPARRPARAAAAPAKPVPGKHTAPKSEPDRLRKLAEDAFAKPAPAGKPAEPKAPRPSPQPRTMRRAAGAAPAQEGWEEF